MHDRAYQALHLLALEPIAETTADPNSYGFRKARSVADAIEQCCNVLSRSTSAQWILEERLADQPRTTSIKLLGSQIFGLFTLPHGAL